MNTEKLQGIIDRTFEDAKKAKLKKYPLEMLIKNIIIEKEVTSFFLAKDINVSNLIDELDDAILSYVKEHNSDTFVAVETCDIFSFEAFARAALDVKQSSDDNDLIVMNEYNILAAAVVSEKSVVSQLFSKYKVVRSMFLPMINKHLESIDMDMDMDMDLDFEIDTPVEKENKIKNTENSLNSFINSDKEQNNNISKNTALKTPACLKNLNELVLSGHINEMVGREYELDRVFTVLNRKKKNNPILTGKPGVGKTALAEGLAYNIVNGKVPKELADKVVYALDVGELVTGTQYRGQLEKRLKTIIETVKATKSILFIDEIHYILGAGNAAGASDMSTLLLPHLTSNDFTVIGATTTESYIKVFEKNSALNRRFNKINLDELSEKETINLLKNVSSFYEDHHGVVISDSVIEKIVSLSGRFITDNQFPDKALDLLDEVSSVVKINPKRTDKNLVEEDVYELVSKIKNIPVSSMRENGTNKAILDLERKMKDRVFGQDKAIEGIVDSMILSFSGLKKENKPMGSFLCVGPTGVGKTEVAKSLAEITNMKLIRFDMSEYMSETSTNRLLGSDAGYVGYDDGGILLTKLKENPFSVVLFDEFEKAHPKIQNIFLQILDEGFVTDSQGRVVDFKNTIIIFTSNAGVLKTNQELNSIGFGSQHKDAAIDMEKIKELFAPEFRNRLSNVLSFNSLDDKSINDIANKSLSQVKDLIMINRDINLKWSSHVVKTIAQEGFDKSMGARPIERKVEELVSKKLARFILKENVTAGKTISILKSNKKDEFFNFKVVK